MHKLIKLLYTSLYLVKFNHKMVSNSIQIHVIPNNSNNVFIMLKVFHNLIYY